MSTPTYTTTTDDDALVARARAGDRDAFGQIYRLYWRMVRYYIRYRVRDVDTVDDLTADVFVRALRTVANTHESNNNIAAWLTTIARCCVYDHFRSARVRAELVTDDIPDDVDTDHVATPDQLVLRRFDQSALHAAIARVAHPRQRQVLTLRYIDGLTPTEAAARMGVGRPAFVMAQQRAVRALRRDARLHRAVTDRELAVAA